MTPLIVFRVLALTAALGVSLALHGCAAEKAAAPLPVVPNAACDFRVRDLNKRLCEEKDGGRYMILPWRGHPCGTCVLP